MHGVFGRISTFTWARICAVLLAACIAFDQGAQAFDQSRQHAIPTGRDATEAGETARGIPTTSPIHPGNVFLSDEQVFCPVPGTLCGTAVEWRLFDDRPAQVSHGQIAEGQAELPLGTLPIGWYRVDFLDADGAVAAWTTLAVLARLAEPVPDDSPVCLDAALSWLAEDDATREQMAGLAALAGVNWIRDRLRWREMQTGPDSYSDPNKYDAAADLQMAQGLKVLQVFHGTPRWAVEEGLDSGHVPGDLRRTYDFCKAVALRFKGRVLAWEPWNEGNAANFGAHTIDELCSHQKAAYLGFKTGDPDVIVGWNPMGGINTAALADGILDNETWPYYDTYNIHSYDWPDAYENLWADARRAASGKPIWVTECDRGMKASSEEPLGDFSHADALRKAEFMAHSYATSLFAGATRHFHFVLGHYMEQNSVQFGLLRLDMTPRPSYVALAALGRLLAGAECLGRWNTDDPDAQVYAFRARPDGRARDVLIAWAERRVDWDQRGACALDWSPPELAVDRVFDYMGRDLGAALPPRLGSAAVFILMPPGETSTLELEQVARPAYRNGEPSQVVLQLQAPDLPAVMVRNGWTEEHYKAMPPDTEADLVLNAYNFGLVTAKGAVTLEYAPETFELTPERWEIEVEPMGRVVLTARLRVTGCATGHVAGLGFRGDFGSLGRPRLAFRPLIQAAHGSE